MRPFDGAEYVYDGIGAVPFESNMVDIIGTDERYAFDLARRQADAFARW